MSNAPERVHTMTDYYDGPRGGMADYLGRPHLYRSLFADSDHTRHDVFELFDVDAETFALALEDWEIWLRWRAAFDCGEVTLDSHPALSSERPRHDEIQAILKPRLESFVDSEITVAGVFEWTPTTCLTQAAPSSVRWTLVDRPTDLA